MNELEYLIKNGGPTPKRLLTKISRRGFGATVLGGLGSMAASRLIGSPTLTEAAGADFTIAIIPDPQWLAESCPDKLGEYYAALMTWIVDNKNMSFTSSGPAFNANIKAVVGVGDCVNSTAGVNQFKNAENAWGILDKNRIAFTTPPGNHDYDGSPSSRSTLGAQFTTGYFSASNRSSVYGSGISLGNGDVAQWIGSYDATGANTAVKFIISGVKMIILAMDFFAGSDAWYWAYGVMSANPDCECYITTHAWLTMHGTQFQRADTYGPDAYGMAPAPYSHSAQEAWSTLKVDTWPHLCGIFSGHDISSGQVLSGTTNALPKWYWHRVPVQSASWRRHTVHQIYANSQELDAGCNASESMMNGAGQSGSVFLLTRRPELGLLEGRMISTHTGDWFGKGPNAFGVGEGWSASETLLFSVPFAGLSAKPIPSPLRTLP